MRIFTERGTMKTMGFVVGATQEFQFYQHLFIGFFGQLDSNGKVSYLGVLEDICTEAQWAEIKNPVKNDEATVIDNSEEKNDTDGQGT